MYAAAPTLASQRWQARRTTPCCTPPTTTLRLPRSARAAFAAGSKGSRCSNRLLGAFSILSSSLPLACSVGIGGYRHERVRLWLRKRPERAVFDSPPVCLGDRSQWFGTPGFGISPAPAEGDRQRGEVTRSVPSRACPRSASRCTPRASHTGSLGGRGRSRVRARRGHRR